MLTGNFGQSIVYFETVSFLGQENDAVFLGVFAKLQK